MLASVQASFSFARESFRTFVSEQPFLFFIVAILLLWSIFSQIIKTRLKRKYLLPYEGAENLENKQFHLHYYKKLQYLNIVGVVLVVFLLFIYLLTKDKIIGTVLAVGVGAILITFQTFTISFVTYFLLVKNYQVWDTIRVGAQGLQGEILSIKALYLGIAGKNDFWEHTGEFYLVPNHHIWTHPITKVNLSSEHTSKHSLNLLYQWDQFSVGFETFVEELKAFLEQLLPRRAASEVSYFKSYIGVKYKMDFSYNNDGEASIWIWFIAKRQEGTEYKQQILAFVEGKKKLQS